MAGRHASGVREQIARAGTPWLLAAHPATVMWRRSGLWVEPPAVKLRLGKSRVALIKGKGGRRLVADPSTDASRRVSCFRRFTGKD
jgi:hypothetical protein